MGGEKREHRLFDCRFSRSPGSDGLPYPPFPGLLADSLGIGNAKHGIDHELQFENVCLLRPIESIIRSIAFVAAASLEAVAQPSSDPMEPIS